jgi:hypothetical protein
VQTDAESKSLILFIGPSPNYRIEQAHVCRKSWSDFNSRVNLAGKVNRAKLSRCNRRWSVDNLQLHCEYCGEPYVRLEMQSRWLRYRLGTVSRGRKKSRIRTACLGEQTAGRKFGRNTRSELGACNSHLTGHNGNYRVCQRRVPLNEDPLRSLSYRSLRRDRTYRQNGLNTRGCSVLERHLRYTIISPSVHCQPG